MTRQIANLSPEVSPVSFEQTKQPRVQWKSRSGIKGSRQNPTPDFQLTEEYPFDLPWLEEMGGRDAYEKAA